MKPLEITRPERTRKGAPEPAKKKRLATSEEMRAFFGGGAVRYTGGPKATRPKCARGHYVAEGVPCKACAAAG